MQDTEKRLEELLTHEMHKLKGLAMNYTEDQVAVRQMEYGLLKQALSLCLMLLRFIITTKSDQLKGQKPVLQSGEKLKSNGKKVRSYLCFFGRFEFGRSSYLSNQRGVIYPLDEALELPKGQWSYNIQELVGSQSAETNFRESVVLLNKLLDLGLSATGSERNLTYLAKNVAEFYENQPIEQVSPTACFSASFDGKGVPKITLSKKYESQNGKRLGRGETKSVKQMATLAVMSNFEPRQRDKTSIINGLMGWHTNKPPSSTNHPTINTNKWHQNIHRRAFLADQAKAIDYGMQHLKARMIHPKNRFVVPIDAGIGLEEKVVKYVKIHGLEERFDGIILDIIHVSEYLWNCANAILGEHSKSKAKWVAALLEDLLDGKTQQVIDYLQLNVDKTSLSPTKKQTVLDTIKYFSNHAHKMKYKTYLQKGYPVSSALVEANCKHLVKDRMEGSGMRWSDNGAQNMLDIRAVKLNGHITDFIDFVSDQERKCLKTAA